MNNILITVLVLGAAFLLFKKFKGGCCGGMKKDASSEKEGHKHEHGDGCCGHKH